MKTNDAGKALIKRWEMLKLNAYVCPAGVLTIGYGHTGDVKMSQVITEHQADVLLDFDLEASEDAVNALVKVPLTENQFSALASFVFNLGRGNFSKSTLLKKVNAKDFAGAAKEFGKWTLAAGKQLPGLVARRASEQALFEAA